MSTVQVVFASVRAGVAHLDCVERGEAGEAGAPCTVDVGLPDAAPWSAAAERILERWADESALVDLAVEPSRLPPKVRLTDGMTTLRLDLATAGSPPR